MTVSDFLSRLESVRSRGTGKWSARCPAHPDKNPSLSVVEGERGLLVRCWAGCSVQSVCGALGIAVSDLFYDNKENRRRLTQRTPRPNLGTIVFRFRLHAACLAIRAEETLTAAQRLDCSNWSDDDFERALTGVSRAYEDWTRADLLEDVAYRLRKRLLERERMRTHAA
ncbi:MAG: hypothetical protein NTNFB02_01520 [Nitrospira sp.]